MVPQDGRVRGWATPLTIRPFKAGRRTARSGSCPAWRLPVGPGRRGAVDIRASPVLGLLRIGKWHLPAPTSGPAGVPSTPATPPSLCAAERAYRSLSNPYRTRRSDRPVGGVERAPAPFEI